MTFNEKLLREAVEWVKLAAMDGSAPIPGQSENVFWDQEDWIKTLDENGEWVSTSGYYDEGEASCGTACCIAGYLAIRTEKPRDLEFETLANLYSSIDNNENNGWSTYGARILGISLDEAARLFDGENDAQAIEEIAEDIIKGYSR